MITKIINIVRMFVTNVYYILSKLYVQNHLIMNGKLCSKSKYDEKREKNDSLDMVRGEREGGVLVLKKTLNETDAMQLCNKT